MIGSGRISVIRELLFSAIVVYLTQFALQISSALAESTSTDFPSVAGNLTTVSVLGFFVHYFIRKEKERDKYFAKAIHLNTRATRELTIAILGSEAGKLLDREKAMNFDKEIEDEELPS